ncbi:hypothetical protein [Streptomyces sp. NPDC002521]
MSELVLLGAGQPVIALAAVGLGLAELTTQVDGSVIDAICLPASSGKVAAWTYVGVVSLPPLLVSRYGW